MAHLVQGVPLPAAEPKPEGHSTGGEDEDKKSTVDPGDVQLDKGEGAEDDVVMESLAFTQLKMSLDVDKRKVLEDEWQVVAKAKRRRPNREGTSANPEATKASAEAAKIILQALAAQGPGGRG